MAGPVRGARAGSGRPDGWRRQEVNQASERLSPALLERIMQYAPPGSVVVTVANSKPNRIIDVGSEGVFVATERTDRLGTGPQLVPAALLMADWRVLETSGALTHREASHRGSFTCALFATFPDVSIVASRPIKLAMRR